MSEGPVANYTEDAVSGFGDPLPGGLPVEPPSGETPDPPEGGEGEGEGTPEPDPEPEPES